MEYSDFYQKIDSLVLEIVSPEIGDLIQTLSGVDADELVKNPGCLNPVLKPWKINPDYQALYSSLKSKLNPVFRKAKKEFGKRHYPGHGYLHGSLAAFLSGQIVFEQVRDSCREIELSITSGLLHDIGRNSKSHEKKGAEIVAEMYFPGFSKKEKSTILDTIINHEYSPNYKPTGDESHDLVVGAVYDADKILGCGPLVWTYTDWIIAKGNKMSPEQVNKVIPTQIKGVRERRSSFRTKIGKEYGPQIIDKGLKVGEEIYSRILDL